MAAGIYYYRQYLNSPRIKVPCEVICETGKDSYIIELKMDLPYYKKRNGDHTTVRRRNVTLLEPLNTQPDVNATDIEYEEEYEWQKYNNK
jgi:hypothetical protein